MTLDKRQKNSIVLFVIVSVLALIMLVISNLVPAESVQLNFKEPINYSENWICKESGEELSNDVVPIQKKQKYTLQNTLPDVISKDSYVFVHFPNTNIKAEIGGERVFETEDKSDSFFGEAPVKIWIAIPLTEAMEGKPISIEIGGLEKNYQLEMYSIGIGGASDLNYKVLKQNLPNLIESSVAIFLGILLLIYGIALKKNHIEDARRAIVFLSLASLTCGVWFVMDGDIMQFFVVNETIQYLLSYISLYYMPIGMILFFREILKYGKKYLTNLLQGYMIATVIVFVLYLVGLLHLAMTLPFVHVFMLLLIVSIIWLCLKGLVVDKDYSVVGPLIAFLLLSVAGVIYMVMFYIANVHDSASIFRRAYLLFLLVLCFTLVRQSLQQFKNIVSWNHYKQLAYVDPVTGGNTRSRFEELVTERIQNTSDSWWLVHMNLVDYKMVNEVLGWENGSKLLKHIYSSCQSLLEEDEIICNLGNASIGILVKTNDMESLHWKIMQFRRETGNCATRMRDNLSLNIHLCASPVTSPEDTLDVLLDHALMANSNPAAEYWQELECYIYNEECRKRLLAEKAMESQLHQALVNHEFEMYLQPKIDPQNGTLGGAEALVRWNSPQYGIIPPAKFVPLFERLGVISKVDLYMFREVCTLLCRWKMQGKSPVVISVNVSKRAFDQPDFMHNYERILKETGAPAEYIEFEFTESIAYSNTKMMKKIMKWIHTQGAKCSMDDFGSSYSNLSAIQTLDFDTVKMDKCFFDQDFPGSERAEKMVSSLIKMFKNLGIKVVTEGIENEEQMQLLKQMNCDLIQGYYYSKPIQVKEFEEKYEI